MRKIPLATLDKIMKKIHTKYNRNQLGFNMTLSRAGSSPLANYHHFEHIDTGIGGVTDCDISAVHDTVYALSSDTWYSVIIDGVCYAYFSTYRHNIKQHLFYKQDTLGNAVACAIGHNGVLYTASDYKEVTLTETKPLIFWVTPEGALLCKNLNTGETTTLVTEGCTDVCCINATRSDDDKFDYGFIVCFLMGRKPFTIQHSEGKWLEPAAVPKMNGEYISISIVKTWDYRIIISCTDTSGNTTRIYSMYQGLGKHTNDHIRITHKFNHIVRNNTPPTIISAKNIDDGTGNMGRLIVLTADQDLHIHRIDPNQFNITPLKPIGVSVVGNTIVLEFVDFNTYYGKDIRVTYNPNNNDYVAGCDTVYNTNYINMKACNITFIPEGLVDTRPPIYPLIVHPTIYTDIKPLLNIKHTFKQDHVRVSSNIEYTPIYLQNYRHYHKCNIRTHATISYTVIKTTDI